MTNPLDTHHTCRAHLERAFEEAFRRHPGDPYRAITWMLHHESSMPNRRADFFLRQLEPLKRATEPAAESPPKPEAAEAALREVLGVLRSALACLTPTYHDALKLADEHGITARDLLVLARYRARRT